MPLDPDELRLFYKLYPSLLCFVNQRRVITSTPFTTPEHFGRLPIEERLKLRDALVADIHLIDAFISENPFMLSEDELEDVRSWEDLVAGEFYVYRCLKKYTVFLTAGEPVVAYGVLSLMDPLEDLIGHRLPHLCKAVLLPFKGRIVYDGMLAGYNITFGSGIRRRLKESYDDAKRAAGDHHDPSAPRRESRPDEGAAHDPAAGDESQDEGQQAHDLGGGTPGT